MRPKWNESKGSTIRMVSVQSEAAAVEKPTDSPAKTVDSTKSKGLSFSSASGSNAGTSAGLASRKRKIAKDGPKGGDQKPPKRSKKEKDSSRFLSFGDAEE